MKSTKCVECGFVGWADAPNCKACGAAITPHAYTLPPPRPVTNAVQYAQWDEPQSPKQGLAVIALIFGILGFFTLGGFILGAIIGSILAWVAMRRAKREPWRYGGHGIAIAGLVLNLAMLVWVPLIAAIAVPNLLAARRAANEGAAIHSLRLISEAQAMYRNNFGKYATLDELAAQRLIDQKLATGTKNGYNFAIELTTDDENLEGFAVTGVPITYRSTGNRSFFVDETQVLRASDNLGGPASKLDQPLYQDTDLQRTRADYRRQTVY